MARLTREQAAAMTSDEKFDLLRQALMFASNTTPYALTDAEHDELLEFIEPLDSAS